MNNSIKNLAESITDLKFINQSELEVMIETYFKIWQNEQTKNLINPNDPILRLRNEITKEREELNVKKESLQRQVDETKEDIKQGKVVDMRWYSRLKSALRITKFQYHQLQDRFAELRLIEKKQNIERSSSRKEEFCANVAFVIKEKYGKEEQLSIFTKAGELTDNINNLIENK